VPKKNRQTPRGVGLAVVRSRIGVVNSSNLKNQTYGLAATADKKRGLIVHKIFHRARNRNKEMDGVNSNR
jgi:hypothetical protein